MIELKKLTKIYSEGNSSNTVMKDLNYNFVDGKIYVMFGRSGSGKSTLLNLISGIDVPTSGSIIINNQDICGMNELNRTLYRRNNIGFIFQFFNLIPTLTVLENLLLPLELVGKVEKNEINKAKELLDSVGLIHKESSFPDRLSGGEQQRIAIARSLIHEPKIILADEPTGNLDYETGMQIINLLDKLIRQQNKMMIMATHSREVMGLADKIISLKDGKITESDNLVS